MGGGEKKPAKFVILVYENDTDIDWNVYKKEGIIVIKLNEILGFDINSDEKYKISDNCHPNAKAWEIIVPVLIKKLNL